VPHRKTIATRYKNVYATLQQFIIFIAQYAPQLEEAFCTAHLIEDKSLSKPKDRFGINRTGRQVVSLTSCAI
jgi:hypothetical protein